MWTRLKKYWAGTNDGNKTDTLEGYALGTLTRHDPKTLKEGGKLTGDIASEIARRITDSAPYVAFLDDAFFEKVTPARGGAPDAGANTGNSTSVKAQNHGSAPHEQNSSLCTTSQTTGAAPPQI